MSDYIDNLSSESFEDGLYEDPELLHKRPLGDDNEEDFAERDSDGDEMFAF